MKRPNKPRCRRQRGSSFVELAAGSITLVIMALFTLDISILMLTYSVNDRACRDAARAAATGGDKVTATKLANAILNTYALSSNLISQPVVDTIDYQDYHGKPPAGTCPFVTVTTKAKAKVIAPALFAAMIGDNGLDISKQYTFPIVQLKLAI